MELILLLFHLFNIELMELILLFHLLIIEPMLHTHTTLMQILGRRLCRRVHCPLDLGGSILGGIEP